MSYYFYAMLHRMRYINRWSLMRNLESENIQEHSQDVAVLAHALALIRQQYFAQDRLCPAPETCALLALFHDAPEMITGDLPTPVKYFNPEIKQAYQQVESYAIQALLAGLPEDLQLHYRPLLAPDPSEPQIREALLLVKAADTLAAYIKCLDELRAGNQEFAQALESCKSKLTALQLPEVEWFREQALAAFQNSLDQLRPQ